MEQVIQFVGSLHKEGRIGKAAARTFACRAVHRHAVKRKWDKIKVLSLPSAWWHFESELTARCILKAPKFNFRVKPVFTGCERNWKVFCLASVRIPARGDKPLRQKLNDELNCQVMTNGKDRTLIHADVFDYMRMLPAMPTAKKFHAIWLDTCSPIDRIADRLKYVPDVLHEDGIVILTVLKGREAVSLPQAREPYINTLFSNLDMHRKSRLEYMDTSPMLQLTFGKNSAASKDQSHQSAA